MSPKLTKDILKSRAQFAQVVTDQYSKIFNKGLDTCSTCQETKEEGQRTVQSEARQRKKAANKAKVEAEAAYLVALENMKEATIARDKAYSKVGIRDKVLANEEAAVKHRQCNAKAIYEIADAAATKNAAADEAAYPKDKKCVMPQKI